MAWLSGRQHGKGSNGMAGLGERHDRSGDGKRLLVGSARVSLSLMLLAGTAILILRRARTRARTAAADTTPLSPDEQCRLDRLLSKES